MRLDDPAADELLGEIDLVPVLEHDIWRLRVYRRARTGPPSMAGWQYCIIDRLDDTLPPLAEWTTTAYVEGLSLSSFDAYWRWGIEHECDPLRMFKPGTFTAAWKRASARVDDLNRQREQALADHRDQFVREADDIVRRYQALIDQVWAEMEAQFD